MQVFAEQHDICRPDFMREDLDNRDVQFAMFQHGPEHQAHAHFRPDCHLRVQAPEAAEDSGQVRAGRILGQPEQDTASQVRFREADDSLVVKAEDLRRIVQKPFAVCREHASAWTPV